MAASTRRAPEQQEPRGDDDPTLSTAAATAPPPAPRAQGGYNNILTNFLSACARNIAASTGVLAPIASARLSSTPADSTTPADPGKRPPAAPGETEGGAAGGDLSAAAPVDDAYYKCHDANSRAAAAGPQVPAAMDMDPTSSSIIAAAADMNRKRRAQLSPRRDRDGVWAFGKGDYCGASRGDRRVKSKGKRPSVPAEQRDDRARSLKKTPGDAFLLDDPVIRSGSTDGEGAGGKTVGRRLEKCQKCRPIWTTMEEYEQDALAAMDGNDEVATVEEAYLRPATAGDKGRKAAADDAKQTAWVEKDEKPKQIGQAEEAAQAPRAPQAPPVETPTEDDNETVSEDIVRVAKTAILVMWRKAGSPPITTSEAGEEGKHRLVHGVHSWRREALEAAVEASSLWSVDEMGSDELARFLELALRAAFDEILEEQEPVAEVHSPTLPSLPQAPGVALAAPASASAAGVLVSSCSRKTSREERGIPLPSSTQKTSELRHAEPVDSACQELWISNFLDMAMKEDGPQPLDWTGKPVKWEPASAIDREARPLELEPARQQHHHQPLPLPQQQQQDSPSPRQSQEPQQPQQPPPAVELPPRCVLPRIPTPPHRRVRVGLSPSLSGSGAGRTAVGAEGGATASDAAGAAPERSSAVPLLGSQDRRQTGEPEISGSSQATREAKGGAASAGSSLARQKKEEMIGGAQAFSSKPTRGGVVAPAVAASAAVPALAPGAVVGCNLEQSAKEGAALKGEGETTLEDIIEESLSLEEYVQKLHLLTMTVAGAMAQLLQAGIRPTAKIGQRERGVDQCTWMFKKFRGALAESRGDRTAAAGAQRRGVQEEASSEQKIQDHNVYSGRLNTIGNNRVGGCAKADMAAVEFRRSMGRQGATVEQKLLNIKYYTGILKVLLLARAGGIVTADSAEVDSDTRLKRARAQQDQNIEDLFRALENRSGALKALEGALIAGITKIEALAVEYQRRMGREGTQFHPVPQERPQAKGTAGDTNIVKDAMAICAARLKTTKVIGKLWTERADATLDVVDVGLEAIGRRVSVAEEQAKAANLTKMSAAFAGTGQARKEEVRPDKNALSREHHARQVKKLEAAQAAGFAKAKAAAQVAGTAKATAQKAGATEPTSQATGAPGSATAAATTTNAPAPDAPVCRAQRRATERLQDKERAKAAREFTQQRKQGMDARGVIGPTLATPQDQLQKRLQQQQPIGAKQSTTRATTPAATLIATAAAAVSATAFRTTTPNTTSAATPAATPTAPAPAASAGATTKAAPAALRGAKNATTGPAVCQPRPVTAAAAAAATASTSAIPAQPSGATVGTPDPGNSTAPGVSSKGNPLDVGGSNHPPHATIARAPPALTRPAATTAPAKNTPGTTAAAPTDVPAVGGARPPIKRNLALRSSQEWRWPRLTGCASAVACDISRAGAVGGTEASARKAGRAGGGRSREAVRVVVKRFAWIGRASAEKATLPWGNWRRGRDPEAWEKMVSSALLRYSR